MYLPLESTILRLLQLPLSQLISDQQTLHSIVSDGRGREALINLGNLSPYHDAPTVPGVSPDLPDDCTVDKVILLHRHGSRGPAGEQRYIESLDATLDRERDIIKAADLPPYLEFLKEYKSHLIPEELSLVGHKELFDHGVQFARLYPTFWTDVVVSTTVPRVIDSSHSFSQAFFGLEEKDITFLTTDDFDDPVPWLAPWEACPGFMASSRKAYEAADQWAEEYIPPIVERLNGLIPGVKFSLDDIRGALYACPYDLAAHIRSPWCDVFTAHELRGLEYELDLIMDGISGHQSTEDDTGPLLGAFYIKKLIDRLTDETLDVEDLYLEFAHDLSILLPMSTMGLNKDASPLSPTHPPKHRKFRTSQQTPFAAEMVWEKFTCDQSFNGPQVRLVLNGETFPLSICDKSENDSQYGTCSMDEFVRANEYSLNVQYHSAIWNATCESGP